MRNAKQRLKENSVLEIFVEKFPCCRKIREAVFIYELKCYLIIYLYAANSYNHLIDFNGKIRKIHIKQLCGGLFFSEAAGY